MSERRSAPLQCHDTQRCPRCGHALVRRGDVHIPGRRVRCASCGLWTFSGASMLASGGKTCPLCGRAVHSLRGRCPRCRHPLRRSLLGRLWAWFRRRPGPAARFAYAPTDTIRSTTVRPRRTLDTLTFRILLRSIETHGIIAPLIVRPRGGAYDLISGHRRLLAAQKLGIKEVPVIVRNAEDDVIEELRTLENASQERWSRLDAAEALERVCLPRDAKTRRRLLDLMEIDPADVPGMLRLLSLPELLKDALSLELVTEDEAVRLAALGDEEQILAALTEQVECRDVRVVENVEAPAREPVV
jgi:ParB/RepB/Spo0J family partition protein